MLAHFVIVLRHLRTPRERPMAFHRLCLLSAALVQAQTQFAYKTEFCFKSFAYKKKTMLSHCLYFGADEGNKSEPFYRLELSESHRFLIKNEIIGFYSLFLIND